jgi:hypothetical protein
MARAFQWRLHPAAVPPGTRALFFSSFFSFFFFFFFFAVVVMMVVGAFDITISRYDAMTTDPEISHGGCGQRW